MVKVVEQRITNFGLPQGYMVEVDGGVSGEFKSVSKADLDKEFSGLSCLVYQDKKGCVILRNDIGYAYDYLRALRLAKKVSEWMERQR